MTARRKRNWPTPTDAGDSKLLADVQDHGWHVVLIEADAEGPGYAFSVGLYETFEHAEVIIFGLDVGVMHRMINAIGEQIRAGERFAHLDESDGALENYNVCFRSMERRHYREYLGYALWFYQGDQFPTLQCFWPDVEGCYPWHAESNRAIVEQQPILSDDKSWPFHEGRNRAAFTTRPVLRQGHPILIVTHDEDGDWQFLCGTTNRQKDCQIVSLGSMFDRDPTIAAVANLEPGWRAFRERPDAEWRRERIEAAE
jgi:hypothetical protein